MTIKTKFCPYCNEEINQFAKKCKHCGEWLEEKPITGSTSVQNPETIIRQALEDRYELMEIIGKGGMATVYKAIQKNLNRIVALKVVHQNLVHDSEFVGRFIREAQLGASLSHPNIITVYDVGSLGSVHYMAMELLEGKDLFQLAREHIVMEVDKLVKWIIPITEALNYIHEKGLIHRDIKSSNIIITKDGRPVLMDFGIAHAADGTKLTQVGTVIGTPEYMSPEQAQGREIDGRSDLYSLGVVMYECLTGKVPFKGDNPLTMIHHVIYEKPISLISHNVKLPGWINQVVLKLLSKESNNRYETGSDLATALSAKKTLEFPQNKTVRKVSKPELKKKNPVKNNSAIIRKLFWAIGVVTILLIILTIKFLYYEENGNNAFLNDGSLSKNQIVIDTKKSELITQQPKKQNRIENIKQVNKKKTENSSSNIQSKPIPSNLKIYTEIDSVSYAIGFLVGSNNIKQLSDAANGEKIDIDQMCIAFKNASLKKGTSMTVDEANTCVSEYFTKKTINNQDIEKASLGIGILVGNNNLNQLKNAPNGDKINMEIMSQAFRDASFGKNQKIEEEQSNLIVKNYFEKSGKKVAKINLKEGEKFLFKNKSRPNIIETVSGLQYEVLTEGSGANPDTEDRIRVHYHGTLIDGSVFDSSIDRGEPAVFGVSQVIKGWTEALMLMQEGAKWKIFIPPHLAYGERGAGNDIGPNSVLIFEIELLEVLEE